MVKDGCVKLPPSKLPELLFAIFWIIAICLGFRLSALAEADVLDVFYYGAQCPVQPLGLLLSMLWPIGLLSGGVLLYGKNAIFPVCVVKGLSYGYCAGCTVRSFGSAGGLGWFFVMFADTGMLWVLCWYSLRRVRLIRSRACWDFIPVGVFVAVFGFLDRLVIAPFLAELFL